MTQTAITFRASWWTRQLARAYGSYVSLSGLLSRPNVAHLYLESLTATNTEGDADPEPTEPSDQLLHLVCFDLDHAQRIYSQQMIVLASTYLELALKDYLQAVLTCFPKRMYDFLGDAASGQPKGSVSLKDILAAASKIDLLGALAERAVATALAGPLTAQFARLKRLSAWDPPHALRERLIRTVELRNKIVHQAYPADVSPQEVIQACFTDAVDLVQSLAQAAQQEDVPLDDPSYLSFIRLVSEDGSFIDI